MRESRTSRHHLGPFPGGETPIVLLARMVFPITVKGFFPWGLSFRTSNTHKCVYGRRAAHTGPKTCRTRSGGVQTSNAVQVWCSDVILEIVYGISLRCSCVTRHAADVFTRVPNTHNTHARTHAQQSLCSLPVFLAPGGVHLVVYLFSTTTTTTAAPTISRKPNKTNTVIADRPCCSKRTTKQRPNNRHVGDA